MQVKRGIVLSAVFTVLLVAFLVMAYALPAGTCSIVSGASCGSDYTVFSLWDTTGGHIAMPNASLPYQLCCNYNGASPYFTTGSCAQGTILSAYDIWNTHVAQNMSSSSALYNICATSTDGFTSCSYNPSNGACTSNETCIGSIDSTSLTNSHFAACNTLGTNVCCSFNQSETLQGVQVAQFEYWCGVSDGVCPEHFADALGNHPVCYPRTDPDC